jgi:hypothetical protein
VEPERHGREIRYRLADPDVIVACSLMRGVLQRRLERLAFLASTASPIAAQRPVTSLLRSPA